MSQYIYSSLGPNSIRLVRLLPNQTQNAPIQCQLCPYSLQESSRQTHLYTALSYVWGDPEITRSIYIDKCTLSVTKNLFEALLRLRDPFFERIIWVDALCINQGDTKEKEQQIQSMPKIYGQADRVNVWLGEAADNSDQALEVIRAAGNGATNSLSNEIQLAVLALLRRGWFRRIWILQEVAAARHVQIICGPTEIDGYAFCLGVDSLRNDYKAPADLQSLIHSVTYLIRGAIFRPSHTISRTGGTSQAMFTLGELVDMYHTHDATKHHDKVYALLGMSSEDLSKTGLLPDYEVSWGNLFQRLARYLICGNVSIHSWENREIVVIRNKGCIIGKISRVQHDTALGGKLGVSVVFENFSRVSGQREAYDAEMTLQPPANPIQDGDLICLLQEASKPMIIRPRKDHFEIIMIAPSLLETGKTKSEYVKWPKLYIRDFLLVWDWKSSSSLQYLEDDTTVRTIDWVSKHSNIKPADFEKATRIWNVAMIIDDIDRYGKAEEWLQEAIEGYEVAFQQEHLNTSKRQDSRTPLSWATGRGYYATTEFLITKANIDPDLKDGQSSRTPLSWAAAHGHEAVVKLLLGTGKVEVDAKDRYGQTPLSLAARNRHEAVVKLLLGTGKVEVNVKHIDGRTPLSWAASNGHEAVVKLLLGTGKVEVDVKDRYGRTPLSLATSNGHEAVVKLLLGTGKVEVDAKDRYGRTPLCNGHEAVVKLLLGTGKVEVDAKDTDGRTPLWWAASNGHEAVVKLLLGTGKVEVDAKDIDGRTPLSWAASNGHEAVVKLLLGTGKVEVDVKDRYGRTPLSWAASNGHEAVVKLLLGTGKVEVDVKDIGGQTPLSWATSNGHEAVVKLLLGTGKVEVDVKDRYGQTPLSLAASNGHEAVVKLLQEYIK
ncbi:hypothetical protein BP5796_09597 [Coleophoma crateriformis]|uniref:Heterokaryon incompatibility domain-containing protein n=1 Tax=Coleophoma crateriformis TaxID=565419 RepID=A0A3D8QYU4_9HELO|nr:hypothetical protein BP5796_09597 [Coleophoma crateriformis]